MKTIGRTTEHNAIVEMTQAEYKLIYHLSRVMDGGDYDYYPMFSSNEDIPEIDLSPAFEAILAFVKSKAMINSLKRHVQQLDETIMHQASESAPE